MYGLLNKLLHYNLLPRASKKKPNMEKLTILDVIVSGQPVDFALVIWEVIKDFAKIEKPLTNLPFGSLVTRMSDHFNVKDYAHDKITPPETGTIGIASSKKRKPRSRGDGAQWDSDDEDYVPIPPTGPSKPVSARSTSRRLDALEITVNRIDVTVQGMATMIKDLFLHTFPERAIPDVPAPPASAPSTSTAVGDEEGEWDSDDEEAESGDDDEGEDSGDDEEDV